MKFQMGEIIRPYDTDITARLADAAGAANQLTDADVGKFVKLKGDSQYGLTALGDEIEGFVKTAQDAGGTTYDGFLLGAVQTDGRKEVTLNGLQATPGTGAIAVGDYVVSGAPVARGTKLNGVAPAVLKATAAKGELTFLWRVVAIKTGAGAPGSIGIIERV